MKLVCLIFIPSYEDGIKKPCLTYFITILYEGKNLDILNINIISMPNGALYSTYGRKVLKAGKILYSNDNPKRNTHAKSIRFNWKETQSFELLQNKPKRIRVAYFNESMDECFKKKLSLVEQLYNE